MCGIAGFYLSGRDQATDRERRALEAMRTSMHLRGPDGSGTTIQGRVGLAHTRLSIIDPDERSAQPMESADWLLTYNGEIYNFHAIRRELEGRQTFRTESDTEVLLLALQEWGIDKALDKCAGMYAFLAYNKRTGILYAARDRLGIKPLFMACLDDATYYFASSPAAIVKSLPEVGWRECKPAIASYFVLGGAFTRMSVFEGIERVDPAHYVAVAPDGTVSRKRYWTPRYRDDFTMEDLAEVVREYKFADVPSALFLSGGVDSTFLATVIDELDFFHLASPETHYAREVAHKYERKFVEVHPDFHDYTGDIRAVCGIHGEPYMSIGIPLTVSREVREHGYKMAISANGADELFHGYPRTPMPEHTPKYLPLYEERTARFFHEQVSHIFRDSRNFLVEEYAEYMPTVAEIAINGVRKHHLPDFPASASHRWFELMTYVLHDLNPTLDAASMAHSIEMRVPFLDHRIVEGVLSWHGKDLVTEQLGRKAPLKRWLLRDFPQSFFSRPKLGFSIDKGKLPKIVESADAALRRARKRGFLKPNKQAQFGHYDRDMIYLQNTCFVYEQWKQADFARLDPAA